MVRMMVSNRTTCGAPQFAICGRKGSARQLPCLSAVTKRRKSSGATTLGVRTTSATQCAGSGQVWVKCSRSEGVGNDKSLVFMRLLGDRPTVGLQILDLAI